MNEKQIIDISRFLSLILRHKPETIGIKLDKNGWADVEELIEKVNKQKQNLDIDILKHIVDTNSKKRFIFSSDLKKIRANQGHSINVDLGLKIEVPPFILYHGTSDDNFDSIMKNGLEKRNRQHVHLSKDIDTAVNVGRRHGKVIVFEVSARKMHTDGFKFFLSENGVWLTDNVPSKYLIKK